MIIEQEDKMMAFCEELSHETIQGVFDIINKSIQEPNTRFNYSDRKEMVSYCTNYKEDMLIVSVVDWGPLPNASLLPILAETLGEPSSTLAKPWVKDNDFMFFAMTWREFKVNKYAV